MERITAIKLSKSENDVRKELKNIINMMMVTKVIKTSYCIEDIILVYLPYYIADFKVELLRKNENIQYEHMYMSLDVGRQARVKALDSIENLITDVLEIPKEMVARCNMDKEKCIEKLRKEMVYRYIPRSTRNFNVHQVDLIKAILVYRPQYLIKYKLFGRTRIFKANGDLYNL